MKIDTVNHGFFTTFSPRPILTQKYYEGEPLEIGNEAQILIGDTLVEDVYRIDK